MFFNFALGDHVDMSELILAHETDPGTCKGKCKKLYEIKSLLTNVNTFTHIGPKNNLSSLNVEPLKFSVLQRRNSVTIQ